MVFAIDFDGTIVKECWPDIGELNPEARHFILCLKQKGHSWILWTLREGEYLQQALRFLSDHGMYPDAINSQHPERMKQWGNDSRKIGADVYIDDRNAGGLVWPWVLLEDMGE